jgi:hypothetical protein
MLPHSKRAWLAVVPGLAGLVGREGGWVGVEGRLLHFTSLHSVVH